MRRIGRFQPFAGAAAIVGVAMSATLALAQGQARQWPPSTAHAKISPIQAMAAAKAKLKGGTPFSANFEFDEGQWTYGVMVVKGHQISEVTVDPMTGVASDVEALTAKGEAQETQSDLARIAKAGG